MCWTQNCGLLSHKAYSDVKQSKLSPKKTVCSIDSSGPTSVYIGLPFSRSPEGFPQCMAETSREWGLRDNRFEVGVAR